MSKFIRHPFLNMVLMYHSELLCRKLSEINLKVYQTKINQGKMLEIDLRKYGLDKVCYTTNKSYKITPITYSQINLQYNISFYVVSLCNLHKLKY